jgi:predicted TIM-barrel fold metal-dependent hydrolase
MKTVGKQNWSEFEPDKEKAMTRGLVLDAQLRAFMIPHPRGVWRMTHKQMNEMDDQRLLASFERLHKTRLSVDLAPLP